MSKAAVLGAGSWGTAFAKVLAEAGTDVTIWARRAEVAQAIGERHENPDYLPGIALPASLRATTDIVWRSTAPTSRCSRCRAVPARTT